MGPLEIMAVIMFGYLIGFKPSDFKNMVILSGAVGLGISIGLLVYFVGSELFLSENGPYAIAVIIFASFVTWKFGAPSKYTEPTIDRRKRARGAPEAAKPQPFVAQRRIVHPASP